MTQFVFSYYTIRSAAIVIPQCTHNAHLSNVSRFSGQAKCNACFLSVSWSLVQMRELTSNAHVEYDQMSTSTLPDINFINEDMTVLNLR